MKKHKYAIRNLRLKLKDLSKVKPKLRAEIHALKFDAEGKRRPDTGPTRYSMKEDYRYRTRPGIRAAMVAFGILRGLPYKRIEPKADTTTYGYYYLQVTVLREIHAACGEDEALKAEWTEARVKSIIKDGADPIALEAA